MTILMEVSPNLDNVESDTILEESSPIKKKSRQKKSEIISPKPELVKDMARDKKRRKKNSETKIIETPGRNGFHETDHSESEMDTSTMENPEDDQVPMDAEEGEPWYASTVGGLDLTSRPAAVSFGGKYVFVNSSGKIMVYSSKSGQLVRKLNTGQVLAIQRTDKEEEVVVATKKKIVIWNFVDVKAAAKFKISSSKVPNYETGLQSSYIPENFHKEHEIYVTVSKKEGKTSLYRLNLDAGSNHQIFNNVKPGTVHVGDSDNLVCAISDHKKHEFKDVSLLVYNKNLAKNMSVHADKDRPFTCARVHPMSRVVAVGDTSGRIMVYSCLDQPVPSKSILHWHSLAVTVLAWSLEGSVLYSGGGEAVLCKWRQEEGSKPNFVPRIGGPVTGLASGAGVNVVQLENNKIKIIDTLSDTVLSSVAGLARNTGGYPAGLVTDRDRLVTNGGTGMVQVYRVTTDSVYSLDITQQNQVAKERGAVPHNSEVESVAVSGDGKYLATVDCLWSDLPRIILKFWHWSEETNNFILNTQVEFPHYQGVRSMRFQPMGPDQSVPLLLSVGNDKKAKLWQLEKSWSCVGCLSFRQLSATGGGWSSDGSVIGLSFGHLVTLWSTLTTSLKTTLSLGAGTEEISGLEFGRGSCSRYLYTTSHSLFITWDLITLSPCWSLNLAPSPHTKIVQSSSFPLLALTQKDTITILSPFTQTTLATIRDVNCTGGCDWLGQDLYFLKYSGEMIRLSRERREAAANMAIMTRPGADITPWLLAARSGTSDGGGGGAPRTQARIMRDIESLLTLPLHTVPATSQLSNTIIRNRLIEQPRQRRRKNIRSHEMEEAGEGVNEDVAKRKQKINDIFKFDAPMGRIDLPDDNKNYKDPDYWNNRFRAEDSFEWLVEYKDVKENISSILLDKSANILQLGCGNSNFSDDMYQDGFTDITNIDISEVCVQKMSSKYPHLRFKTMDMTAMTYKSLSFDVVFEKATLDSLVVDCKSPWDLKDPSYVELLKALKEVKKVLKPGGLFISITFTQPHFRVPLLASQGLGWSIQVEKFGREGSVLDYYLMICRDGDPGPALDRWSVTSGPVINNNETWESSDEEGEFISKLEITCFDSDSEDESNNNSSGQ